MEIPQGRLAASPDKKGVLLAAEADAAAHVERLQAADYRVVKVERKERKRSPAPPFTTSTMQQEAARKLGFSARKTMTLAQRLYEGVDLPGEGTVGLITYMRTDSLTIADTALREIAELVTSEYGDGVHAGRAAPLQDDAPATRRRRTRRSAPPAPCARPSGSPPPWTAISSASTP